MLELSYRRDLESLGHMMLYFFSGDRLQRHLSPKQLCQGLPNAFVAYFRYVRSLSVNQKPEYSYLRNIFNDLFLGKCFERDFVFDWTSRKYKEMEALASPRATQETILYFTSNLPIEVLKAEVDDICVKALLVEKECIQIRSTDYAHWNDAQWIRFINLHRDLLFKYHDLFQISYRPDGAESLRNRVFEMSNRLWEHALLGPLLLLRDSLSSTRFMSYFRLAYKMMALLYRTVPSRKILWAKYLRRLAYLMSTTKLAGTAGEEDWQRRYASLNPT
jgi:hypothetical protein